MLLAIRVDTLILFVKNASQLWVGLSSPQACGLSTIVESILSLNSRDISSLRLLPSASFSIEVVRSAKVTGGQYRTTTLPGTDICLPVEER
jgi:hypothetical protein